MVEIKFYIITIEKEEKKMVRRTVEIEYDIFTMKKIMGIGTVENKLYIFTKGKGEKKMDG